MGVITYFGGNGRFALLLQGLYYPLVMMVLPLILTGPIAPTLLTESVWMAIWFLVGLVLLQRLVNEIIA